MVFIDKETFETGSTSSESVFGVLSDGCKVKAKIGQCGNQDQPPPTFSTFKSHCFCP